MSWRAITAVAGASLAAVVIRTLMSRRRTSGKKLKVAVGSKTRIKLDAAERALNATAIGIEAASLVAGQPMGFDDTLRGARNRLLQVCDADECSGMDMAIGIENGLIRGGAGADSETWVDIAVVFVRDLRTGHESIATSAGVQFPSNAVGDWAESGGEGTVGHLLAEEYKCDKQDPHGHITKGQFSRGVLLEHAIRVAVSQLVV